MRVTGTGTLVAAAVAGILVGCAGNQPAPQSGTATTEGPIAKHDCKGKNECKGQGGCKVEGKHACKGQNSCKGQGGCKTT
jgi:hypothetical protein